MSQENTEKRIMEQDQKLVNEALDKLGEHFDSAFVICTRADGEIQGNIEVCDIRGNKFAVIGSVWGWLERTRGVRQSEGMCAHAMSCQPPPPQGPE